jgi:adenylate kinase family enzyme
MVRIHVTGASGSGTTTLGAALAESLNIPHLDSDHFYWLPTDPPFQTPRDFSARVAMLQERARPDAPWVLSGSALKWGMSIEPLYSLIVFLRLDPALRMERIRQRETSRYGHRILPGGDMAETSQAFLKWAESYDTAGPEQRSLASHEAWLSNQVTPILRLDSAKPVEQLLDEVLLHPVLCQARQP